MPVNTAALKTFAPAMRRQLIEAVGRKLDLLLHQTSADTLTTAAGPIEELRQQEAVNRQVSTDTQKVLTADTKKSSLLGGIFPFVSTMGWVIAWGC